MDPRIPAKEQDSGCHDNHWLSGGPLRDAAVTGAGREHFRREPQSSLFLLLRMRNCWDWLGIHGSAIMPMVAGIIASD